MQVDTLVHSEREKEELYKKEEGAYLYVEVDHLIVVIGAYRL